MATTAHVTVTISKELQIIRYLDMTFPLYCGTFTNLLLGPPIAACRVTGTGQAHVL